MTKPPLATITFLAALVYSSASARTDLTENYTDFPPSHASTQQERYAARSECEVQNYASSPPAAQSASTIPTKPSLLERLQEVLKNECGKVRVDKNEIVCEDYLRCTKEETIDLDCEYCQNSTLVCTEGQMKERWRFNPDNIGKVEALLIDKQYIKGSYYIFSLEYALRPVGRNELYLFQSKFVTQEAKNTLNSYEPSKP